jgi:hypothetical protein
MPQSTDTPNTNIAAVTSGTEPRVFHTVLVFRCTSTLSERLAAYAAERGFKAISRAIRELLEQALKAA